MRPILYGTAVVAVLAIVPPPLVRNVLASTAATLIESTPFLLLGVLLARVPRLSGVIAHVGCGCNGGPSARSIPAAIATWLLFGPLVAIARLIAATAVALLATRGKPLQLKPEERHGPSLIAELQALLPAAIISAIVLAILPSIEISRAGTAGQIAVGVILGFLATPCALGTVALAGALHATAPVATTAYLCIAGIVDLRALPHSHRHAARNSDSLVGAALATLALLIVAARHGGELVNPRATIPLAITGIATLGIGLRVRGEASLVQLLAPATMLFGVLVSAPAPIYDATETTMTDLFVGERLTFTGVLDHEQGGDALVRYAITCCRADASPVAIRLSHPLGGDAGWYAASGTVVQMGNILGLHARRVDSVTPPTDPFIYR